MSQKNPPRAPQRPAPKTVSAAAAKAQLADCLRAAETGTPVVITRYGQPVAALVSAADFAQLERLRAAGPEAGLAGLAGLYSDGAELTDALDMLVAERETPYGQWRPLPEMGLERGEE